MTNTIRPYVAMSLLMQGEVQTGTRARARGLPEVCETPTGHGSSRSETRFREPVTLGGQLKSDGRARKVVGDGMQGRSCHVNQGDQPGERLVFMRSVPKSQPGRSQSVHSSEEAG